MHFVTCKIALNEENSTLVARDEFRPVSWPELEVIRFLHGEGSVIDPKPFVSVQSSAKDEKERLGLIYGRDTVDFVFPGKVPSMEMDAPGVKAFTKVTWKNPISGELVTAN